MGLSWKPGPGTLPPAPLALSGSVLVTEKPNLLGSALRPLLPSPTPFQGLRDLFYLQSLKKPVAKVTGAGTAGSLPWGRGFAPKQLSVGAVPAGTSAFACSGRKQPQENTFPLLCSLRSPSTASLHWFLSPGAASQPAQKCSNNKQKTSLCSPLSPHKLACTHALIIPLAVG